MNRLFSIAIFLFYAVACNAQAEDFLSEKKYLTRFCAKYALDETPNLPADTNLIAIWKMDEDADEHNYFVMERYNYNRFAFTYMNRGGSNRTYENYPAFFSKIGDMNFLNIRCDDGYFFLKVTDLDSRGWNMTLSLVADTTLKDITSRKALQERILKNAGNPNFYSKPVHFRKKLPLMYCK